MTNTAEDFAAHGETLGFSPRRAKKVGQHYLLTVDDALNIRHGDYLVKTLIAPKELSVWYGQPGSGKSFLMLHVAYSVAQGAEVLGKRVRQSPVVYLSLEAHNGLGRRVKALSEGRGKTADFYYIAQAVDFNDQDAIANVITDLRAVKARLLIVDTMARAMSGANENDSDSMGAFLKGCQAIMDATSCHVAIVHHEGKTENTGPRGHSSLLGAADVVVEISGKEGTRAGEVKKNKEHSSGDLFAFNLRSVGLGFDDDGDEITTCLVDEVEAAPVTGKRRPLKPEQVIFRQQLMNAFTSCTVHNIAPESGMGIQRCVTRTDLYGVLAAKGLIETGRTVTDSVTGAVTREPVSSKDRQATKRNLEAMQIHQIANFNAEYVWLLGDKP
jgi:KaiC/GvpD/RAD55 family RecA-like ATPase